MLLVDNLIALVGVHIFTPSAHGKNLLEDVIVLIDASVDKLLARVRLDFRLGLVQIRVSAQQG